MRRFRSSNCTPKQPPAKPNKSAVRSSQFLRVRTAELRGSAVPSSQFGSQFELRNCGAQR